MHSMLCPANLQKACAALLHNQTCEVLKHDGVAPDASWVVIGSHDLDAAAQKCHLQASGFRQPK